MSAKYLRERQHIDSAYLSSPFRNLLCLRTAQLCSSRLQDFRYPGRAQRFLQLTVRERFGEITDDTNRRT